MVTREPIDVAALTARVAGPDRGAIASFLGVVRDHHGGRQVVELEYSAYEAMANRVLEDIRTEAERRWPVTVAAEHRLGVLAIGDAAVYVAAGAAHRDDAFSACRWVIEEIKRRVPIWKRERYADGTEAWVDPTAPGGTHPAGSPVAP